MGNVSRLAVHGLSLAIWSTFPGLAVAETPLWDFSVSAFGGTATPFSTDLRQVDPSVPQDITGHDVQLDTSASFGGKVSAWNTASRQSFSFDIGLEADVTHFSPDIDSQFVRASGTSSGMPVIGAVTNDVDLSTTIVAANLLLRFPMAVAANWPHGAWYPYLGGGTGASITEATIGGGSQTDTAVVVQAIAGIKAFVTRQVALFSEYKFTHASHTFSVGTGTNEADLNVNHLDLGIAFHF